VETCFNSINEFSSPIGSESEISTEIKEFKTGDFIRWDCMATDNEDSDSDHEHNKSSCDEEEGETNSAISVYF